MCDGGKASHLCTMCRLNFLTNCPTPDHIKYGNCKYFNAYVCDDCDPHKWLQNIKRFHAALETEHFIVPHTPISCEDCARLINQRINYRRAKKETP